MQCTEARAGLLANHTQEPWITCLLGDAAQNQALCSPDGTVCLVPQGDGNLVLCAPAQPALGTTLYFGFRIINSLHVCLNKSCISFRYNETLVAMYGASAGTAIFATGTYGAAAQGHPAPYTLTMQTVALPPSCHASAKAPLWTP